MLEPVVSGIVFGLLLAIMLGPVFFALLQTSLHEGFKSGVHLALGILLSDAFCIAVVYFFATQIDIAGENKIAAGWIGGILLMGFGAFNFLRKVKQKEVDDNKKTVHAKFIFKGFVLNTFNPAVWLLWLGIISLIKLKEDYTTIHEAFFFTTVVLTAFGMDMLKSFVADRISHLLNAAVLHWINWIVGSVLIAFGLRMIFKVI